MLIVLLLECIKARFKAHFKALRSGFPMVLITFFFVRDKDPFPRHGHIYWLLKLRKCSIIIIFKLVKSFNSVTFHVNDYENTVIQFSV